MAERVKDETAKASWLRIATGYRELARMTQLEHRVTDSHGWLS